ncbi:hypothetical protein YK48G_18860 [Lentilactobacillus fungorum]|uniref:Surface layer protein A domain-containing protein n=1 Tax=Lentilactobacillus fungorum TaxID=2201250 RepID=A0ABQ3W202_9LACO|nr:hypothetical protein [Lentilactobacillus fungorum]GHP14461.1 hypothetical protein YK48G_18860 [Lentilactobacillus fungorum]
MKSLKLVLATVALTLGLGWGFASTPATAATELATVPKNMRGAWKEYSANGRQYYDTIHYTATTSYYYYHNKHHQLKRKLYNLATWAPTTKRVRISNPIYSAGHGRYSIWWQLHGAAGATMHPNYYRITTRNVLGHRHKVLISYSGPQFGGLYSIAIKK